MVTCLRMSVASFLGSLLRKLGRREPGTILGKDVNFLCLALVVPIRLQYKTTEWEKMLTRKCTSIRKLHLESWGNFSWNIFQVCRRGASPDGPRSKLTIVTVGLRDQLVEHTSQHMYKMCVTQLNRVANAPRTKSEIVNSRTAIKYNINIAWQLSNSHDNHY